MSSFCSLVDDDKNSNNSSCVFQIIEPRFCRVTPRIREFEPYLNFFFSKGDFTGGKKHMYSLRSMSKSLRKMDKIPGRRTSGTAHDGSSVSSSVS